MRPHLFVIVALTGAAAPVGAVSKPAAETSSLESAQGTIETEIWKLLLPPAKSAEPTVAGISASIVRLGPSAVPVIAGILTGEIVEPAEVLDVHPRAIELRREILVTSLRGLPAGDVVDQLKAKASQSDALDVKLVVVQLLGEIGGARALETVLAIAAGIEPIHWMRTYVQVPIEESLTQMLTREPRLLKIVTEKSARLDARLCPIVVRAACRVGSPSVAPWLTSLIGREAELDLAIVEELTRFAEQTYCALSTDELAKVRALLDTREARVQRAAATALGAFGDADSVTRLVSLLGSTDPSVVRATHMSLKRLTGQALEADRGEWLAYCEAEQQWHDENWSGLVDGLHSTELANVADAAIAFGQHPLYRSPAASELRALLNGDDVDRTRLAAGALGTLGSRAAVPWLIECLKHEDETVRTNAWQSLRTLTGRKLPPDPDSWTDLASS